MRADFPGLVTLGALIAIVSMLPAAARPAAASPRIVAGAVDALPPVATFSIVACDTVEKEWGVAVASRFLAVGSVVPWAEAGVGAVATQAIADTRLGPEGLDLMARGASAPQALEALMTPPEQPAIRQIGLVDAKGNTATFTGERCDQWAGGVQGPGFAAQGNILAGPDVVQAMADAFQGSEGSLAERLLAALKAGNDAGGDRRGKQSAALLVVKDKGGYRGGNDRYIDLRVDDAEAPVAELVRLYKLQAKTFLPAVHTRLGDEALKAGNRERADREYARVIHLYRAAIRDFPDDPEPKNGLAWFYVQHRVNLDEALRLATAAQSEAPDSWEVLDTLTEIALVRGQLNQALDFAQKALEVDPQNDYLKGQAARVKAEIEKKEKR
jgi:uncharacterized Ntn-hydrolase superfamily protein